MGFKFVILWTDVVASVSSMSQETESFASRCKKMPKKLRDWDAYTALKKKIEDFQLVLPLLQTADSAEQPWVQTISASSYPWGT